MNNKIIVIVDGYSNGGFFAPKLKARGYSCVHVQSRTKIPEILMSTFRKDDYLEQFIHLGNIKETLSQLQKYEILCVIPGAETGVELADQLSEKIGLLSSNGTQLSAARRDKFIMVETLKNAGLKTVQHIQSNKVKEILVWAKKLNKWPVVVKPLKSAGNDQVCFCHSEHEIEIAFNSIINTETVLFDKNEAVLAQSYLHDEQYEINAVSFAGKHYISDIWLCKRLIVHHTGVAYDHIQLLPSKYNKELTNYVSKVLDALGIKYGASHSQVMLEVDGPVIIECAARVMGSINQDYIARATGKSQVDLTIDSYIDPQYFLQEITESYELKNNLLVKLLLSSDQGKIKTIKFIDKIKQLKSFYSLDLHVKVGSQLKRTVDLCSCPGHVYLLHKNKEVLWDDYRKLVILEKQMFEVSR